MAKKNRTPEEIDQEMEEQEEAPEEETEEEEQEDESEDEDDTPDEPDTEMLLETEADLLCLGYSPEQLAKLLPPLVKGFADIRKASTQDMPGHVGPEMAVLINEVYDEIMLPALQEAIRRCRANHGANHVQLQRFVDWLSARFLRDLTQWYPKYLAAQGWPKPENG